MRVKIRCQGEDAQACLKDIAKLINDKFGEGQ